MSQQGGMSQRELQMDFMYLFERMSEHLGMGTKGSTDSMVYYVVPPSGDTPTSVRPTSEMSQFVKHTIQVSRPAQMPMKELQKSQMCPRQGLFGYFVPQHRQALRIMKQILLKEKNARDLLNMACACRDSQMVNSHLFVNALAGCLASHPATKGFNMPAFYETMPDLFFTDHVMKQAEKMARMPQDCKSVILVDRNTTGHQSDPESRMWYFREDIGVNSHHFHWHVVFPGDSSMKNEKRQDRRGELFYYMHHSMIARYEAERLCNGLSRTKMLDFDNLVIEEGYFGKLYSTNAGRHWGTRQANTRLINLNGANDGNPQGMTWDLKVEDLKRWRDRIFESIDTGYIIQRDPIKGENRKKLDEVTGIDVLGDMIENSSDTSPHLQFYGEIGFHNMGHVLIAFSNDPHGKYKENLGPMGDTSTAMRDPAFYKWHKYIDDMLDKYKRTLPPYQMKEGTWPLLLDNVVVNSIEVRNSNAKYQGNTLSTFWMQSNIDLARGLDFWRTNANSAGPVFARITHVNYDKFDYHIRVTNTGAPIDSTVRIFLAPRKDEHGDDLRLEMQRILFFELDKFSFKLKTGSNEIKRSSLDSSVTVKWENSFRQLETLNNMISRDDVNVANTMGNCGCGWPQHLLLPRGTSSGTSFDLFVMVTKDAVRTSPNKPTCRDAMSFCGILDEAFPDPRPMGYPFDRTPFNDPKTANMPMQTPIATIEEYAKAISNAGTIQIRIVHEPDRVEIRKDEAPPEMGMINEKGEIMKPPCGAGSAAIKNPPTTNDRGGKNFNNSWSNAVDNADRGQPPRVQGWPANRGTNQQWGGPQRGYRGGRQNEPEGDWDYLDNMNINDTF